MSTRQNHKKTKKKKSKVGKIILSIVLVIALVVVGVGGYTWYMFQPVSSDTTTIPFSVEEGETPSAVAEALASEGIIRSDLAFKAAMKMTGKDNFKTGVYDLSQNMNVYQIIDKFVNGERTTEVRLTIPEGRDISQFSATIAEALGVSQEEVIKQIDDVDFIKSIQADYWFLTDDIFNPEVKHPLEGYLFPDTYFIYNDETVQSVVVRMLDAMETQLEPLKADMQSSSHTINEQMTLASIVEKETIEASDRPIVAGVFYNRLASDMRLGSDVTVGYSLDKHDINYTEEELDNDSPYNTYKAFGLPPGPISTSGITAIEAVVHPDVNDYYYFIADICTDNKVYYAATIEEHDANVAKYLTCYRTGE